MSGRALVLPEDTPGTRGQSHEKTVPNSIQGSISSKKTVQNELARKGVTHPQLAMHQSSR